MTLVRSFVSDGCSGGLSWLWSRLYRCRLVRTERAPWYGCCVDHDYHYWLGNSAAVTRREADTRLRRCVADRGYPRLAWLMYVGVRIGGSDWLPTPWRWGYGHQMQPKSWLPAILCTAILAIIIWG